MKSKLMNFDGAKALTKEEQKAIIGGCGCNSDNFNYGSGRWCHMC